MKSTLRVDFAGLQKEGAGQFEPVIRLAVVGTEDVRDKLLQTFIESLKHTSNWLRISYSPKATCGTAADAKDYIIYPITTEEFKCNALEMLDRAGESKYSISKMTICDVEYDIIKCETETFTVNEPEHDGPLYSPALNTFLGQTKDGRLEFKCNKIGDEYFIFRKSNLVV